MGRLFRRISKNGVIGLALVSSLSVGCVIILIGMTFYKNRIAGITSAETANYHKYQYHYAIISEESDAPFWEDIYQGAMEKGEELDIYVEKTGNNLQASYHLDDLMRIAIASKVDGIIIEPNGTEEISDLINMAEASGIPVITVLKDAPESNRTSFVGINSYNQGLTYGKQVLEVVQNGRRRVTVLMNSDSKDASQNTIYSNISEIVAGWGAELETATVNTQSTFSSEEDIRDIIMSVDPPEVLVCLPEIDSVTAYQTLVDYNKLNDITIIGFYDSELIIRAIEMRNIHSTMTINAKQMGATCVEALTEFRQSGQVSDYFSVDIRVINSRNVKDYMKSMMLDEVKQQ